MGKIVVANWKMNPQTLKEAEFLFHSFCDALIGKNKISLIICPPFIYIDFLSKIKSNIILGAQDCHWENSGSFTGEISPLMLKNLGVKYVILGHSERRWIMNEDGKMINKKVKAALRQNLIPILAIGERVRNIGYENVLINQLIEGLEGLNKNDIEKIIIAYEPVWAIGSGLADKPQDTIKVIKLIQGFLNSKFKMKKSTPKILYGGSINSENVVDFVKEPLIDGLLIGGASVDKEEFLRVINIIFKYENH